MISTKIYEGSILDVKADVLVNPANVFLMHGGGLAYIIAKEAIGPFRAEDAGPDKVGRDWAGMQRGMLAVGSAVLHPPGHLADRGFKGVIHAVGPIWAGGRCLEQELLESAYQHSLEVAYEAHYKTIALPAISAGIFGVPIEVVSEAAATVMARSGLPIEATFALMDDEHIKVFEWQMRRYNVL